MTRRLTFIVALALASFLFGCAPSWRVVTQAAPNPMTGAKAFAVMPIDYANLMVGEKSEAQYLSAKDDTQQKSFAEDKAAVNAEFAKALISSAGKNGIGIELATGPGSAAFLIKPSVSFVEPGTYAVVVSRPSMVQMTLKITTPDGKVVDEIALQHSTDSRGGFSVGGISTNPSSGGRLRKDGEGLGDIVAKYLQTRVHPGG